MNYLNMKGPKVKTEEVASLAENLFKLPKEQAAEFSNYFQLVAYMVYNDIHQACSYRDMYELWLDFIKLKREQQLLIYGNLNARYHSLFDQFDTQITILKTNLISLFENIEMHFFENPEITSRSNSSDSDNSFETFGNSSHEL
jgi:hypothetical protein